MAATWRMRMALPEEVARRAVNILADRFCGVAGGRVRGRWRAGWSRSTSRTVPNARQCSRRCATWWASRFPKPPSRRRGPRTGWPRASPGLPPVRVGRFVVHGAHDREKVGANQIGIEIEAALAFGTGHHGTTRGCLAAIERVGKVRRPRRVLDVGTGTGVLAIAAARAFRRPVVAGDFDPVAVATARANARMNRAGLFRARCACRGR